MGTLCSFILILAIASYTYYKVDVLFSKKSVDVVSAVKENYFTSDDQFSASQGLNFAVALFDKQKSYVSSSEIDPSYGRIRISK